MNDVLHGILDPIQEEYLYSLGNDLNIADGVKHKNVEM